MSSLRNKLLIDLNKMSDPHIEDNTPTQQLEIVIDNSLNLKKEILLDNILATIGYWVIYKTHVPPSNLTKALRKIGDLWSFKYLSQNEINSTPPRLTFSELKNDINYLIDINSNVFNLIFDDDIDKKYKRNIIHGIWNNSSNCENNSNI